MIIMLIKVKTCKDLLQLRILNALQVYHPTFQKTAGKFPPTLQLLFLAREGK